MNISIVLISSFLLITGYIIFRQAKIYMELSFTINNIQF